MTKYVNTADLAAHFNVAAATIMSMVRSGGIPSGMYMRVGKVFRFNLEAIEQYLLSQTSASDVDTSDAPENAQAKSPEPVQYEFDFDADTDEATEADDADDGETTHR